ncbi:hypothetical protein PVBG_06205, partial [Plasmodium vivax Brazil I]
SVQNTISGLINEVVSLAVLGVSGGIDALLLHVNILQLEPSLEEEVDVQMECPVFSMDSSQKDFHDMKTIMMEIWD